MLAGFEKYKNLFDQQKEMSEYSALDATNLQPDDNEEKYLTSDDVEEWSIIIYFFIIMSN